MRGKKMQILMAHFKNYKKEVLSAIISIFIVAFVAVWQPRLLQYVLTAIVQDNQAEVRNYGIQLIILAFVGIIAGIVNVYSRSEEHTSELQSRFDLVCRLLLEKKK